MKLTPVFVLALAAAACASASQAQPQDSGEASPVAISSYGIVAAGGTGRDARARKQAVIRFESKSDRDVVALVLIIRMKDNTGASAGVMSNTITTNGVIPSLARGPYRPGEIWESVQELPYSPDPGREISQMTVEIDYVLFAGGANWGPDKAKKSAFLKGLQAGGRAERDAIRTKLASDGIAATVSEVEKDAKKKNRQPY